MNTLISLATALPAAYAFSRYQFVGDKQIFFWLLTNRMAPAAVFAVTLFQPLLSIHLIDTHIAVALAHCLFNVPLAVWILEGFMSGIPREIDETAFIDGYSFPRFFITIFIPLIRAGVGVTAFFCFMFSWVELLFARTLTVTNAKPIVSRYDADDQRDRSGLGLDGCSGCAHHRTGCVGDLVRTQPHGQGLRPGPGIKEEYTMTLEWMYWTLPTAIFFIVIFLILTAMTIWQTVSPSVERRGFLPITTTPGDRLFIGIISAALHPSCLDRIHRSEPLDCASYCGGLDHCCHDLGVNKA